MARRWRRDDWSNKDDDGLDAIVNLHIGSRYRGTKRIERVNGQASYSIAFC